MAKHIKIAVDITEEMVIEYLNEYFKSRGQARWRKNDNLKKCLKSNLSSWGHWKDQNRGTNF